MIYYTIVIPIHNEFKFIPNLIKSLEIYGKKKNEILIIDDGSTDGSTDLLINNDLINLIKLEKNQGKGFAIRQGLKKAKYNKIVIFDGDMELNVLDISRLMILDKKNNIHFTTGHRFKKLSPLKSNFDWGNFMFTSFFNIAFQSNNKDILCCAKSFYLDDINIYKLKSNGFGIDAELTTILTIKNRKSFIPRILLDYKRRSIKEGKKLKISDGWNILSRIIKMMKYL